jgi:cytochrome c biogenesis protein CcdA
MLPAYFASSFQNRRLLVAMTFLFAAGVATVILLIAMGAQALRNVFITEHTPIYVTGGLLMLGFGAYALLGGQRPPHARPPRRSGGAPWRLFPWGCSPESPVHAVPRFSRASSPSRGSHRRSGLPSGSVPPTCSGWSRRCS